MLHNNYNYFETDGRGKKAKDVMIESMTKLATEVPGSLGSPQFPRGFRTFLNRLTHPLGAWNRLKESWKN